MDEQLAAQVRAALAELRSLRSTDPSARRANETIRLTARTLEYFWLPTLESVERT